VFRTSPEVYGTRAKAEQALWKMADNGRADCHHDRRYLALVLMATFASLRWGEVTALRRCDIDLEAGTVRVRAALVERSTGEILIGPPKSRAGRRVVGIPRVIIPVLREHLSIYVKDEPGAPAFPGAQGGPLRRGNFNKMRRGRTRRGRSVPKVCTFMICGIPATHSPRPAARAYGISWPGWATTASVRR
jgi:integrase